ncbi:MAG: hypothetical protein AB1778_04985 [Candidatus Bipolaricaulota bacterium]
MVGKAMGKAVAVLLICGATSGLAAAGDVFFDASLGYSVEVPTGWELLRPNANSVRIEGPDDVALEIRNIATAAIGGAYATVDGLVAELRCRAAMESGEVHLTSVGELDVWDTDGAKLEARQFVVERDDAGEELVTWHAVVLHASGSVLFALTYAGPASGYARSQHVASELLGTWQVGGASETGSADTATASDEAGDIHVILEDRGHIGPYLYAQSAYDKRLYEFTVSVAGYVALCVVDEEGEAITGWIFAADGMEVTRKPGNYADVYTSAYPIAPGTYTVKVGQDNMVTESDFQMAVYFSLTAFTLDDLVARFGPRVRVLP